MLLSGRSPEPGLVEVGLLINYNLWGRNFPLSSFAMCMSYLFSGTAPDMGAFETK